MQIRNLSPCTQQSYLDQVTRFANHFQQSPERLGPEQIRDYQLFLAAEKRLAPGSIGVAVSALRFLYGVTLGRDWDIREILPAPKQPSTLPVVPSPEEAVRFLDAVTPSANRAVLTACYAAGLRVSEAVSLRPRDIDSARMVIRVEQGKGAKDRYTMLSQRLLEILRDYWRRTRPEGGALAGAGLDALDHGAAPGALHPHVAEQSARVLGVAAAVPGPCGLQHAPSGAFQAGDGCLAEDAQPAPAAGLALPGRARAGQHHGRFARALGDDLPARLDDDRRVRAPSLDQGARIEGEGGQRRRAPRRVIRHPGCQRAT